MGYIKRKGVVFYVADIDYAHGVLIVANGNAPFTLCSQEYRVFDTCEQAYMSPANV